MLHSERSLAKKRAAQRSYVEFGDLAHIPEGEMFRLLGALLALYTTHAAISGEVFAKSGISGRTVLRTESPRYFWVVIMIYAALSVALITVF